MNENSETGQTWITLLCRRLNKSRRFIQVQWTCGRLKTEGQLCVVFYFCFRKLFVCSSFASESERRKYETFKCYVINNPAHVLTQEVIWAGEKPADALQCGSHLNVNKIPIIHNFTCPQHLPTLPPPLFILLTLSPLTSQFTAGLDQIACALWC